jgi:hypothetical protein
VAEQRFIFYERLFGHMAEFRAAGYRYAFTPKDLAYRDHGKTVLAYQLDEILLKVTTVTKDEKKKSVKTVAYRNPDSVDMVEKTTKKKGKDGKLIEVPTGRYEVVIDPPLAKNSVELAAPNGVPIELYYKDTEDPVRPPTKLGSAEAVPTINCCTSTLSAFYTEWKRIAHAGHANDNAQARARRLPLQFHKYFMITPGLADFVGGGAVACDRVAQLVVRDAGKSWLADLRDMRRGDIAQIFWNGYKNPVWEKRETVTDKKGQEKVVWKRVGSEPVVDDPDAKRLVRDLDYAGHSVFIHDVLQRDGKLYFQVLSAQGNDVAVGGTRGVGLAGAGRDAYSADAPGLQAELFERAKCYRYDKDNRSAPYTIVPELFVGRLRRPFPCWPVALTPADGAKVPLPQAYAGSGLVTNLHADDVVHIAAAGYLANCETAGSGFYPIGVSRAWHGGVHFKVKAGTPVRAIADGVIVAARCAGKPDGPGPSRNFVLVRHQVAAGNAVRVFYSLLMHLRHEAAGNRPIDARWLWQFDRTARIDKKSLPHPDDQALAGGAVTCMAYPVAAGDVVGFSDGDYLHFEIFSEQDIADDGYPHKQLVEDNDGDALYDSKKLLSLLEAHGDLGTHLKSLAPSPGAAQSGVVLQEEIVEFFGSGCDKAREALRGLLTKHVSEWSVAAKWPELRDTAAWAYYDTATAKALQEAQERNAWLTADIARWCKLPSDGVLVHYHPVVFIDWLAGKTASGAFEPVVQRVSEILDGGAAPAATAAPANEPDAGADDDGPQGAGPRWEIDPSAGLETLAVGTLGSGDSFVRKRREAGPWTQIGLLRLSVKGQSEFVKIAGGSGLWICVRSAGKQYARRVA